MSFENLLFHLLKQSELNSIELGQYSERNASVYYDTRDDVWWVERRRWRREVTNTGRANWFHDPEEALREAQRWCT